MTGRAFAAAAALRRHPRHVMAAALVLGLLAAGVAATTRLHTSQLVLAVAAPAGALAARAAWRGSRRDGALGLAAVAAVIAGAALGTARVEVLERSALPARFGHAQVGEVTLVEAVRRRDYGTRTAIVRLDGERVLLRVPRTVRWAGAEVGDRLFVRGGLDAPGVLGAAAHAHAELRADELRATGRRRGGIPGVVDGIRRRAQRALTQDLPPPLVALLRGMVLGQDGEMPDGMRTDFRASGLSHLVAASGQNVMLLAALAFAVAAMLGVGRRARLAGVLVLVALYVPLAGAGPSIQRAGVMGAAGVVAALAGRPASRSYAVLLAALATLGLDPRACADAGWQLSFAAVIALLALAPALRERLTRRGLPRGLAEAVAVTVAASIATAPLLAVHFGRLSLVSLAANVLAVPAVAPVMWLGMVAAALGQVSPVLAEPFTTLAGLPLGYLATLAHAAAGLPGAATKASPWAVTAGCCGLAMLVARPARDRWRPGGTPPRPRGVATAGAAVLVLTLLVAGVAGSREPPAAPGHLRLTFLDVGQGDATLVQHGDAAVLVDTGTPDGPVVARLRQAGVRRLDVLAVTHAEADHEGGAAVVLRSFPVALLLDGRDGRRSPSGDAMAAVATRLRVRRVVPRAGMGIRIGAIGLRVLWPVAGPGRSSADPSADPNLRATVLEVHDGAFTALLGADAESDVLAPLDLHDVDALKVSHHGSADDGLAALLGRLAPEVAVISVGAHNTYGHPTAATLRTLDTAVPNVFRTDRDGSVRLDVTPHGTAVTTHA